MSYILKYYLLSLIKNSAATSDDLEIFDKKLFLNKSIL